MALRDYLPMKGTKRFQWADAPDLSLDRFADEIDALIGAIDVGADVQDVTVTYDGTNVASVTKGSVTTTYTYLGDLVDTDSTVIGATTITRQYVYDGAGNLTSIEVI